MTERNSNIELLRIFAIIIIIAHHFVFHSGFWTIPELLGNVPPAVESKSDWFLLALGWGGKMAINIFLLITGYFMCLSNITFKKFLKLFGEMVFYKLGIFLILLCCGAVAFSVTSLIRAMVPVGSITTDFLSCYLFFFLLIPFINKLIHAINKTEHAALLALLIGIYSVWGSLSYVTVTFNYVSWFTVVYLIGAYIRLYPAKAFDSKILTGFAMALCLALSWGTIPFCGYYLSIDCNRILAVLTSVSMFLFFKNLDLGCNRVVNAIASTTLGVLLIHDNGYMRERLWTQYLHCAQYRSSENVILYSLAVVLSIYAVCVVIDLLRQFILERPIFSRIKDYPIPFLPSIERKHD